MNEEIHARAERLILESRSTGLSPADRDWLERHMEACLSCAARAASVDAAIRWLRLVPVRVNPAVVEATRLRVRTRAKQLRGRRLPQVWLCLACAASWIWIAASAPWLWREFAWAAGKMRIPSPLWQMGFATWWAVPALAAAAALSLRSLQDADAKMN